VLVIFPNFGISIFRIKMVMAVVKIISERKHNRLHNEGPEVENFIIKHTHLVLI